VEQATCPVDCKMIPMWLVCQSFAKMTGLRKMMLGVKSSLRIREIETKKKQNLTPFK